MNREIKREREREEEREEEREREIYILGGRGMEIEHREREK